MRIVARSQTAKCEALGARRGRASKQDPSPPSPAHVTSEPPRAVCSIGWMEGPSDGLTSQRFSVDRSIEAIELPIAHCTFSNSASNLTDMILHLFWYQGEGTTDVPTSLIHSGERKLELILRSDVASPFPFIFSMTTQTPSAALLCRPPRTKIRIIDFTSINHAGDSGERQVG